MPAKTLSLFDLAPGKVLLDHYKITKTNRMGGMSTTFQVVNPRVKEPLEIQVFPGALFESKKQADEFAESMRAWQKWIRRTCSPRTKSSRSTTAPSCS